MFKNHRVTLEYKVHKEMVETGRKLILKDNQQKTNKFVLALKNVQKWLQKLQPTQKFIYDSSKNFFNEAQLTNRKIFEFIFLRF